MQADCGAPPNEHGVFYAVAWRFSPLGGLGTSSSPDWNQVNAIYCPAARCETLRCRFNQGIYLGSIKSGMSSVQFKITTIRTVSAPSSSISIVVQMPLTL